MKVGDKIEYIKVKSGAENCENCYKGGMPSAPALEAEGEPAAAADS